MYYEVIMVNGKSFFFDTEEEYQEFIDNRDDWDSVMVRGEFGDY